MAIADRITAKIADPYNPRSLGYRARSARMHRLFGRFPTFADMHVVDLGGDTRFWRSSPLRPAHVTVVAIEAWALADPEPWMSGVLADACDRAAVPGTYDLVFSNSVIEHVGGPRHRRGFAETVHALAPHHWVQTPYRYFPLEPHFVFPGFQFLPPAAKVTVAERWPLSRLNGRDPVAYVMDHELLTVTEMRALFPESALLYERNAGLVKSLIAAR